MGCWSESCAVSGMEIRDGAEIYAVRFTSDYNDDLLLTIPPVRGKYDDYGGIDLTEDAEVFGLKAGQNWRPDGEDDESDESTGFCFIDAAVFDYFKEIVPEFTYGDRPKTLGEAWLRHREKVVELLKSWIDNRDSKDDPMEKALRMVRADSSRVFGYGDRGIKDINLKFMDLIHEKNATLESLEPLIELYGRAYLLTAGLRELRKKLSTGLSRGPQHGGAQALIPFYRFVLMLARSRQEEDREDCWSMEELDKDFPLDTWKAECALDKTQLGFRDWQVEKALAE